MPPQVSGSARTRSTDDQDSLKSMVDGTATNRQVWTLNKILTARLNRDNSIVTASAAGNTVTTYINSSKLMQLSQYQSVPASITAGWQHPGHVTHTEQLNHSIHTSLSLAYAHNDTQTHWQLVMCSFHF